MLLQITLLILQITLLIPQFKGTYAVYLLFNHDALLTTPGPLHLFLQSTRHFTGLQVQKQMLHIYHSSLAFIIISVTKDKLLPSL
jgi:hypothetical protein